MLRTQRAFNTRIQKTQGQTQGVDRVGVNHTISHCSNCGSDFEGDVEDMLICCSLAGMFQVTRIAAHALSTALLGTPKHGAALIRPKCVIVNISVPRMIYSHMLWTFSDKLYRPPCTRRHLFRDTGGSCCSAFQLDWGFLPSKSCSAYFATHLDVFIYYTLWQFEPWEVHWMKHETKPKWVFEAYNVDLPTSTIAWFFKKNLFELNMRDTTVDSEFNCGNEIQWSNIILCRSMSLLLEVQRFSCFGSTWWIPGSSVTMNRRAIALTLCL